MLPRASTITALVVLIVAFGVGFFAWRRSSNAARPLRPQVAASASAPTVTDVAAPSPSPRRYTLRSETTVGDSTFDAPQMRSIAKDTAQDYRRRARYPRSSRPIEDDVDPIARDREVTHDRSLGPEGHDPTLVTFPARTSFEAPNPILLYAYLIQNEEKVDAREIRAEVRNQQGQPLVALEFRDDGKEGDVAAGDLVFTARLAPPKTQIRDFKGPQLVEVHAKTLADEERIAATGFLYSVPLAHLTGRYRDELADGHLVVAAEVLVDEPGRFHLEATLAGADGKPLAWAQNAVELAAGTAWIPLTYWGLILRERAVDGPYVLRSVALSTTGEMPNQKNDAVADAYVTAAYRADQFSERSFEDPDLIDAAERLEAESPLAAGALEAGGR